LNAGLLFVLLASPSIVPAQVVHREGHTSRKWLPGQNSRTPDYGNQIVLTLSALSPRVPEALTKEASREVSGQILDDGSATEPHHHSLFKPSTDMQSRAVV